MLQKGLQARDAQAGIAVGQLSASGKVLNWSANAQEFDFAAWLAEDELNVLEAVLDTSASGVNTVGKVDA